MSVQCQRDDEDAGSRFDFVLLQETHSTHSSAAAFGKKLSRTHSYFASHGTQASAGVGILISKQYVRKWFPEGDPQWCEVDPGYLATHS